MREQGYKYLKEVRNYSDFYLECLINYYALYNKQMWLALLEEKLRRSELEIAII